MARKAINEKKQELLGKMEALQAQLDDLEAAEMVRLGKLAKDSGLLELGLSDTDLKKEFAAIAGRFPAQGTPAQSPAAKQSA